MTTKAELEIRIEVLEGCIDVLVNNIIVLTETLNQVIDSQSILFLNAPTRLKVNYPIEDE